MAMPAVTPQSEPAPREATADDRDGHPNPDPDPTAGASPRSRYARTLAELEAGAHIPLEDQTEEQATPPARASSEAWDEERRQLRLAGGPM
jgi:hypothetical protein